jgi:hypothetical protein
MGEKDHDREREYSPNPPHVIGRPANEDPDAVRAELYQYHKRAGSLGAFYAMYPRDWVTADDKRREPHLADRERRC